MNTINPIGIVQGTTHAIAGERSSLFWTQAFEAVHKIHLIFRTVEKAMTYGNPDNFVKLLAGHTLSATIGDNIFVKIGSTTVLIAMRIMECVKEKLLLIKEIHKLYRTLFDTSFLTRNQPWVKPGDRVFLSPSFTYYFRSLFAKFLDGLIKVVKLLLAILKRLFLLSMRILDTTEAFSMNPDVIRQGTRELFVNYDRCLEALTENRDMLLDFLKEYKTVIESILKGFGNICTYETLLSKLQESKEPEGFTLKKYAYFAFQHAMFGLFQSVNLHHYMPTKWIPPLEPEWFQVKEEYPRYPPKEWVQIYNYEEWKKRVVIKC